LNKFSKLLILLNIILKFLIVNGCYKFLPFVLINQHLIDLFGMQQKLPFITETTA